MNRFLPGALAILGAAMAVPAFAGDVGVSIGINQPGFYGEINLGSMPPPRVIYAQPVVIERPPVDYAEPPPPIYLHVPPGHERHWRRHCAEYHACGRPVYFVNHDWYRREYVPRQEHHEEYRDREEYRDGEDHRERGHGHDHEHGRDRDEGRGHDERRD